jgi:competence protein ComEC
MTWPRQPLLLVGLACWAGSVGAWVVIEGDAPTWLQVQLAGFVLLGAILPLVAPALARFRFAAALLCLGLLAGASSAATYLAAARPEEVRQWAEQQAELQVAGTVRETATSAGDSGRVRVTVAVRAIAGEDTHLALRTTALLLGGPEVLGSVERGTHLRVRGRILPLKPWREPAITVAVHEILQRAPPGGFEGFVAEARSRMWQVLQAKDPDASSLVAGLAIGDDSRQSPELAEAMRVSGLSHLTAVSGGNIMILAGAVIMVASLAGALLPTRIVLAVAAVVLYTAFVGPQPSVLRAAAMGCTALLGLMRTTRSGGPPALGGAVLLLICARPGLALSWGFALSVAATAGILLLAPRVDSLVSGHAPRLPAAAVAAFSVTVAAQLATAPLLAAMTGSVSVVGLAANLVAGPLVVPITLLGLLLVIAASALPVAAPVLASIVEPFGQMLAAVARTAADVPYATAAVPSAAGAVGTAAVVLAVGGAILVVTARRQGRTPDEPVSNHDRP